MRSEARCWRVVWQGEHCYTTSGGFGYRLNQSIALGYVNSDKATPGTKLHVRILGEAVEATVVAEPLFDPSNEKLRA